MYDPRDVIALLSVEDAGPITKNITTSLLRNSQFVEVPAGTKRIEALLCAGGGGGSGFTGDGGGAGQTAIMHIPVTPDTSDSLYVVIGAGGASGASGGDTSVLTSSGYLLARVSGGSPGLPIGATNKLYGTVLWYPTSLDIVTTSSLANDQQISGTPPVGMRRVQGPTPYSIYSTMAGGGGNLSGDTNSKKIVEATGVNNQAKIGTGVGFTSFSYLPSSSTGTANYSSGFFAKGGGRCINYGSQVTTTSVPVTFTPYNFGSPGSGGSLNYGLSSGATAAASWALGTTGVPNSVPSGSHMCGGGGYKIVNSSATYACTVTCYTSRGGTVPFTIGNTIGEDLSSPTSKMRRLWLGSTSGPFAGGGEVGTVGAVIPAGGTGFIAVPGGGGAGWLGSGGNGGVQLNGYSNPGVGGDGGGGGGAGAPGSNNGGVGGNGFAVLRFFL